MTADPQVRHIRDMAERVARSHGLDIFDVELQRGPGGWVLRIILDRPVQRSPSGDVLVEPPGTGVSLDDCQQVSEDLGPLLDVEDTLEQGYTLEVSSPGLDRPLRHMDDYRRFAGRLAKLVVPEGLPGDGPEGGRGQKHVEGRLQAVDEPETGGEPSVLVEVGPTRVVRVPLRLVSRAKLVVEF